MTSRDSNFISGGGGAFLALPPFIRRLERVAFSNQVADFEGLLLASVGLSMALLTPRFVSASSPQLDRVEQPIQVALCGFFQTDVIAFLSHLYWNLWPHCVCLCVSPFLTATSIGCHSFIAFYLDLVALLALPCLFMLIDYFLTPPRRCVTSFHQIGSCFCVHFRGLRGL